MLKDTVKLCNLGSAKYYANIFMIVEVFIVNVVHAKLIVHAN